MPFDSGRRALLARWRRSVNYRSARVSDSPPAADRPDTATFDRGIGRYVLPMRTAASAVTAMSAVCTREGCIVSGVDGPVFVCPCHGSRYDHTGSVLRGRAPAALPQLPPSSPVLS